MFFLFKMFAQLKHGPAAVKEFEEQQRRPALKPQWRPKQKIAKRRK